MFYRRNTSELAIPGDGGLYEQFMAIVFMILDDLGHVRGHGKSTIDSICSIDKEWLDRNL